MPELRTYPGVTNLDSTGYWLEKYYRLDDVRKLKDRAEGESLAHIATKLSQWPTVRDEFLEHPDHPDAIRLRRLATAVWVLAPQFFSETEARDFAENLDMDKRQGISAEEPEPVELTPETIVDLYWFWSRMELPQLKPIDLRRISELPTNLDK